MSEPAGVKNSYGDVSEPAGAKNSHGDVSEPVVTEAGFDGVMFECAASAAASVYLCAKLTCLAAAAKVAAISDHVLDTLLLASGALACEHLLYKSAR